MVLVELLLRTCKVEVVLCLVFPRQGENLLKVSELDVIVRTLRLNSIELVKFLLKGKWWNAVGIFLFLQFSSLYGGWTAKQS